MERGAALECSPGRKPGGRVSIWISSPELFNRTEPRACARGYTLTPLRGWIVETHEPGGRAFLGDLQILSDAVIAHQVWVRSAARALRQQRQVDLGPVPVGVVGKDDVRSGLPDDVGEPLRGPDVILKGFPVGVEPCSAPENREVRSAVVFHRNQNRDGARRVTGCDVERERRVAQREFLAVGGDDVAL